MGEYSEECLQYFLENQLQLFDEKVAETPEEAEAFLEDCMAVVVDSIKEVKEYLEDSGMDASDMSDDELEAAAEVFSLPNGQYLIVEG
ncbi:glyoxalase [Murimonas intestini]|uniref:Glyoxalase n=1 Tax=Murimonas intestini TaxID=1337051 RepID=A0AB73T7H0_9FIRM|nr:glyoxalase [Murimonas intestini]MCR1841184.1 glyoxalase [Murimonas intestini]MCR1866102.1 glyoxalase [Murimonas intestini]MCR1882781.1 glyoxalase [Murimonas intestini]